MRQNKDKDDDKDPGPTATTPSGALKMSDAWKTKMGPFFRLLDVPLEEGTRRILGAEPKLVGGATDRAAKQMADPTMVDPAALQAIFNDVPTADFREALHGLQGKARDAEATAVAGRTGSGRLPLRSAAPSLIPEPPPSGSFLEALAATTTFERDEALGIQALVEAHFVDRNGVYGLPERLMKAIRDRAEQRGQQVGDGYRELRDYVTERRYGLDRKAPTDEERTRLFSKLGPLHRAVGTFHQALNGWQEDANRDQRQLANVILFGQELEYPDPEDVLLASETLIAFLKDAFSGDGAMTARALAYEGGKIREMLERKDLLTLLRVNDTAEMQQVLGYRVDKAACMMERTVVRYVTAATCLVPNVTSAAEAGPLLGELHKIGRRLTGWMANGTFPAAREHARKNRYPDAEPPLGSARTSDAWRR